MRIKVKVFKLQCIIMPEYKRQVTFNNCVQVLEFEDGEYESLYEEELHDYDDEENLTFFERLKKILMMYFITLKLLFSSKDKQI